MNPNYNQNYTREEIDTVLAKIRFCVEKNRYTISLNENRQENIDFISEYNNEYEVLYVFVPQVQLFNAEGEEETVDIYTKFNVIDLPSGSRAVVISFHKRNKPIDYLFR